MKYVKIRAVIAFVLIVAWCLLLYGCFFKKEPEPEETPETPTVEETPPPEAPVSIPISSDKFTLRYNSKSSFNPITCTDADNLLVSALMYESLFLLDKNFVPVPVLCESYESNPEYTEYIFTIKPDINMTDGSVLTAGDVAYTINNARLTGRFTNRLSIIESVTTEDSRTVAITLSHPNRHFIKLLDIPIIKSGYIDSRVPPGTGPYLSAESGSDNLVRFSGHRDFSKLPIGVVYLRECGNLELVEMFSDGEISLICDDPTSANEFYISRRHETRYYDTTAFQYIGFNARTAALENSELRRAIGLAADREYITQTIMGGNASAAPLTIPHYYEFYDTAWQPDTDSFFEMSAIFADIGLDDTNNDSYLEYPVGDGQYAEFAVDFIVNSENRYKVESAVRIADTLRRVGLNITVRELQWDEFLTALDDGDFDMYYGELTLTADLNLAPILAPGGRLDFGGMGDMRYMEIIDAFFAAETDEDEKKAAEALCAEVYQNAPIIPIAYKRHAVHSVRGVVTGAAPSQSSVFFALTDWTIHPGGVKPR